MTLGPMHRQRTPPNREEATGTSPRTLNARHPSVAMYLFALGCGRRQRLDCHPFSKRGKSVQCVSRAVKKT